VYFAADGTDTVFMPGAAGRCGATAEIPPAATYHRNNRVDQSSSILTQAGDSVTVALVIAVVYQLLNVTERKPRRIGSHRHSAIEVEP
jgi:hypothetical protein